MRARARTAGGHLPADGTRPRRWTGLFYRATQGGHRMGRGGGTRGASPVTGRSERSPAAGVRSARRAGSPQGMATATDARAPAGFAPWGPPRQRGPARAASVARGGPEAAGWKAVAGATVARRRARQRHGAIRAGRWPGRARPPLPTARAIKPACPVADAPRGAHRRRTNRPSARPPARRRYRPATPGEVMTLGSRTSASVTGATSPFSTANSAMPRPVSSISLVSAAAAS